MLLLLWCEGHLSCKKDLLLSVPKKQLIYVGLGQLNKNQNCLYYGCHHTGHDVPGIAE